MKKFDIAGMPAAGHGQREKNVFYQTPEFKMRVISLDPGESISRCDMASHVVFVCMKGEAEVSIGGEKIALSEGLGLVAEPASVSMRTDTGARLLGIQIEKARAGTDPRGL